LTIIAVYNNFSHSYNYINVMWRKNMAAVVDKEACTGCGVCVDVCPVEAIIMENEKASITDECSECGVCVDECPSDAISL
jgi:formate hydrogenlyase subunit 6/NADH:ubiquinone oxidoreductase subunit I